MAAVAAEPGASAAATTTAGEGAEPEWETAQPLAAEPELKAEAAAERVPGMDLACLCEDGDAAQECSVAPPREAQCSAVPEAGGRAHCHREEDDEHGSAGEPGASRSVTAPTNPGCEAEAHHQGELDGGAAERSAPLSPAGAEPEAADEVSGGSPGRTGLVSSCSPELETAAVPLETEELAAPALLLLCATESRGPEGDRTTGSAAGSDAPFTDAPGDAHRGEDAALGRAPAHTATGRDSPRGDARTDPAAVECEAAGLKLAAGSGEERGLRTEPIAGLIPGSEVRVSLDHIIDDALVVSFRLGEKVFSGVLMDLSKRFGPYGIPVTVFPKREYRDKPEPMQLKTDLLPSDAEKGGDGSSADPLHTEPSQVSTVPTPSPVLDSVPDQWTLKPPPLFQEGAPYPPPLFIRDTYSQSIPQPPPRKIKRPKRKLYREEPTSIMSAIKLRPRQVLCDKCKGAVVGDKREVRKAPAGDCRGDEAKRRRGEGAPAVGKRPRTDPRAEERGRASEGSRVRVSTSTGQAKANNVVKVVTSSTSSHASNSRVQLNTKKVLQSKNVDHSKAREVLKMAKEAHRRQRDKVGSGARARTPMTRASSLQDQKVHFTRRLHQISGGAGGGNTAPLPPRIRIKPQRYRNEENNSSPYKPPGFEKVPGSRTAPKPAAPRCTSTRSSSSSSCSGGVATAAAAESHGLTEELEPELSPQVSPHSHSHSHPELEPSPIPKPFKDDGEPEPETEAEETGGREERREKRGPKAGNLTVYMSLHPGQPDSSSVSVCSVDSADDLKSSNSECSSTETLDFPPPGALHSPPVPSTSSIGIASSTTSSFSSSSVPKEEKKSSKPLKTAVFSKNVSKCVTADGRTICVGDIVWAKIYGFPWWPARILVITVSRKDNGLLVRQEARISWFGSPTTSFLALSQVTPFLENFQSRFDKKRKGLYRKAIAEAAKAAKQLTPEVRALLTQFET